MATFIDQKSDNAVTMILKSSEHLKTQTRTVRSIAFDKRSQSSTINKKVLAP